MFALPLRLRDMTIGAMNLFHVEQIPMDERDVIVARAFADLAAISVMQHRAVTETQRVNEQLSGALTEPYRDRTGQRHALRASPRRPRRGI